MAQTSEVAGVCTVKRPLGCLPHRPVPLPEAPALSCDGISLRRCCLGTKQLYVDSALLFHFPPTERGSAQCLHLARFTTSLGPSSDQGAPSVFEGGGVFVCMWRECVSASHTRDCFRASAPPRSVPVTGGPGPLDCSQINEFL